MLRHRLGVYILSLITWKVSFLLKVMYFFYMFGFLFLTFLYIIQLEMDFDGFLFWCGRTFKHDKLESVKLEGQQFQLLIFSR